MLNTIVLVKDLNDAVSLKEEVFRNNDVFSFSVEAHKILENKGIKHYIAEDYLSEKERLKVFDIVSGLHQWYKNQNELNALQYDEINILGLMDTIEFHQFLLKEFINFFTLKNIIEREKPSKIIATESFSDILKTMNCEKNMIAEIHSIKAMEKLQWEDVRIKQNIGNLPISFNITRSKYIKIKYVWEKIICSFFNLWFDFKKSKQKTVIFLEFSPPLYRELIVNLRKHGFNVIFLNRRKPAVFDFKSISLLRNTGAKIINYNDLLDSKEKTQLYSLRDDYLKKLEYVFSKNEVLSNIFLIEGFSLWNIIKKQLIRNYKNRMEEYLFLLIITKKILEKINISCIMALNEMGETEKSFLAVNKHRIPSIMLEHGFSIFVPNTVRFSILSNYPNFSDKIAVWSSNQKNFLEKFYNIKSERIFVTGSPRHDLLFNKEPVVKKKLLKILIAPTPITQMQGFDTTNFHLKFESVLTKICSILQGHSTEIILKLHPSQSYHNEIIQEIIKRADRNITIHLLTSITDLIETSDSVITITPEGWGPSTVILEAIMLKKPIMNIVLDSHFYDFPYVKEKAILIASPESNLQECIDKLLFDHDFRNELIKNGQNFINSYLYMPGRASENLTNKINSLLEN
jgi:hypothetical protein